MKSGSCFTGILIAVLMLGIRPLAAAPFGASNIVIYRAGSGTGNEVSTGNPVFLDEYTTNGVLVQSVAMPTNASGAQLPLVTSGTATSEGLLSRSVDGRYLVVPGYGTTNGGPATLTGTASVAVPRVIGRVDHNANVDTSTGLTNWTTGSNVRGVASTDGSAFWGGGGAGLNYAPALGVTNSTVLSSGNFRAVGIFNNQIYITSSSAATTRGIATLGTGLPATGGQTVTLLPGMTDNVTLKSPYGFFFCHLNGAGSTPDTLYVCDDSGTAPGGLNKFSLVAGSWVANGSVGALGESYRGLCGTVSGTSVTLFATRKGGGGAAGGGELVKFIDANGYNVSINALNVASNLLAVAAANTAFRGVALAPVAFTVTYDGNGNTGGTAPTDPTAYASGASVTVAGGGSLVKSGFAFTNWNTAANGSGTSYATNAAFLITSNTTLYAQYISASSSTTFYCTLTGPGENPPNNSPGVGFGTVVLNGAQTQITVDLNWSGLTAPATAGHIHGPAGAGTNASVLFPFASVAAGTSGSIPQQTFSITPTQVGYLNAGYLYMNIHNSAFPGGEIRGQILLNSAVGSAPVITSPTRLGNGSLQFNFTNQTGASFTVFATTNVALPLNAWSSLGAAVETPAASGQYQFTDSQATNNSLRFYRVRSP